MTAKTWPQPFELFLEDGVTALAWHEGPLARAVRGETIANFDIVIKHRDNGKSISLVANGGPIQADSQEQSGMIVYHDITAAKEAERQLRHAQKMEALGQLTGGTPVQTLPRTDLARTVRRALDTPTAGKKPDRNCGQKVRIRTSTRYCVSRRVTSGGARSKQ